MSEFNLGNTPNTAALIIVRGEVQDNHVHNFHQIMRYGGELAVVTTAELEDVNPVVGIPLVYRGLSSELHDVLDHRRQCADWVADYARERHGLERFTYDVHLLDGEVDRPDVEGVDNLRPHWKGVARYLTDRVPYPREADGGSAVWQYRPFQLEDTQLTGTPDPSEVDRSSVEYLTRLVEELRASRYPVRFQYATATLLGEKNGDINAARVTFTYPTIAKFQRTNSPEEATYNAEGDRIQQRTEISSRTYRAPVSPELQQALDLAREQTRLATAKAIETWGDEDYFITADDGTTNYNNEALLAPIHNSI